MCARIVRAAAGIALALAAGPAASWSRPGHMVGAMIAYEELASSDPALLTRIVSLLEAHPDRGAFEVAIGRARGEERARRLFMEAARWPDDARGTPYDRPTWHYAVRPIIDANASPAVAAAARPQGAAHEAFALAVTVAADAGAPDGERAIALCWIFHLIGDIHQPLHAGQQFSQRHPRGDRAGSLQFVRDPITQEAVTLHWLWDDSVHREDDPASAIAHAKRLRERFPPRSFAMLDDAAPSAFASWAEESYRIASTLTYRADLAASLDRQQAAAPPPAYVEETREVATQRLTLSGYRLAHALRYVLDEPR